MGIPIDKIRGVSSTHAKTLREHGLGNSDKYLAATKTAKMRRELAQKLGVEEKMVLEHANRCDLARVKGIGVMYSNLLEDAGVDTVKELSKRLPENLVNTCAERNVGKTICKRNPTLKEVKYWVAQAKRLKPALEY
jgi:predicted flap endonuclease-1-like 5' DNA nuclease